MFLTLFGTIAGFEARTYGKPPMALSDAWIDVRSEVPLAGNDFAFVVNRRQTEAGLLTWIGFYRAAHEITVSRGGHYGAGIWLINKVAPGAMVAKLLQLMADEIARLAIENGKFHRGFSAIESSLQWHDEVGNELRRRLLDHQGGGLGWGSRPTLLMDAADPPYSENVGMIIDAAQSWAGFSGYQALVISTQDRVTRAVVSEARLNAIKPDEWLRSAGAEANKALSERDAAQSAVAKAQAQAQAEAAAMVNELQARLQAAATRHSAMASEAEHWRLAAETAEKSVFRANDTAARLQDQLRQKEAELAAKEQMIHPTLAVGAWKPHSQGDLLDENSPNWQVKSRVASQNTPTRPYERSAEIARDSRSSARERNGQAQDWMTRAHAAERKPRFKIGRRMALGAFALLAGFAVSMKNCTGDKEKVGNGEETRVFEKSALNSCVAGWKSGNQVNVDISVISKGDNVVKLAGNIWNLSCQPSRPTKCRDADEDSIVQQIRALQDKSNLHFGFLLQTIKLQLPSGCNSLGEDGWALGSPAIEADIAAMLNFAPQASIPIPTASNRNSTTPKTPTALATKTAKDMIAGEMKPKSIKSQAMNAGAEATANSQRQSRKGKSAEKSASAVGEAIPSIGTPTVAE